MGQNESPESVDLPEFVPLPHRNSEVWKRVEKIDVSKIKNCDDFLLILQSLGGKERSSFLGLQGCIEAYSSKKFFNQLLPFVINDLLKKTPQILVKDYPFLPQRTNTKVELTKEEVAVLFVNAFFSTFEFGNDWALNDVNFWSFHCTSPQYGANRAKGLMFLNYFERLMNKSEKCKDNFIIERKYMAKNPQIFTESEKPLKKVIVFQKGLIEDSQTARQADFANKFIGGGVLQMGNVQEEIRFSVNPDCILTMLFCPCMLEEEAVVIHNSERFSNYTGYGGRLGFGGDYVDEFAGQYEIVAMDALDFRSGGARSQWDKEKIDRELWKSFVAFHGGNKKISSGNWGCGAFRGDKELKFIIQWLAASENGKDMDYYTFETLEPGLKLSERIGELQEFVVEKGLKVKDLYKCLVDLDGVLVNRSTFDALKKHLEK